MRRVRLIEDVVAERFEIYFKDHWWQWIWKFDRGYNYHSTSGISYEKREPRLVMAKERVIALETSKIIYETPKPVYYP